MTAQEAIKCFEPIVDHEAYTDRFQDACKIAIEALEKQIPKKVLEDDLLDNLGRCQCCQKIVGIHQKYCWNCGQALDWSEEE